MQNGLHRWNLITSVLKDKDQRSWILLNPTSVGDTWTVCALAKAFTETHGERITMVVKTSQSALAQFFQSHIFKIITIEDRELETLCDKVQYFDSFIIDQPIIAHPFWHGDGRLDRIMLLNKLPGRGGISMVDMSRYILHLDWSAALATPLVPAVWIEEAIHYANNLGIVKGRSIILFPDNNTVESLPDFFWQILANELLNIGYSVFTNMKGNAKGPRLAPLSGTKAIDVNMNMAIPLVEYAGNFISGNNGFAFMLIASKVNAKCTWLINQRRKGNEYSCNGTIVEDPISYTGLTYTGIEHAGVEEIVVCPDEDIAPAVAQIINVYS